jgi:S-methylmethionine-dependent homocysteine/selenocysteine methylase
MTDIFIFIFKIILIIEIENKICNLSLPLLNLFLLVSLKFRKEKRMETQLDSCDAKYRNDLPQLTGKPFITDGGLETTLIFHEGFELPYFAAFDLMRYPIGLSAIEKYYQEYLSIAKKYQVGFILESPTWRSSPDWGEKLGYSKNDLWEINQKSIELLQQIRVNFEDELTSIVISGCIGPRGDGYNPTIRMSTEEAEEYHSFQINAFSQACADLITALTISYTEEAIGIVNAAQKASIPVVISFTLETDGKLPSGETLESAIETVDAMTNCGPAYYMINCAHPTHFEKVLKNAGDWKTRLRGIRANASRLSHTELDEMEYLDDGNPHELGNLYGELSAILPNATVWGGCCGTDHRHIEEISRFCI